MASSSSSRKIGHTFEPTKPHFFKVVLGHAIRDKKIDIPMRFAKKYGNYLPSSVVLKVPSGAKWQVQLIKSDGVIWLGYGWQDFSDYYALTLGSFLIFEYDKKNCYFNVIIFDRSASEIDYPYIVNGDNERINNLEEAQNDFSGQNLEDFLPNRKVKEESPERINNLDRSASEIDYPYIVNGNNERINNLEEAQNDFSGQNLEDFLPNRKVKEESPENPTRPKTCKKRKLENPTRKFEEKGHGCYSGKNQLLTKIEKAIVLHRARTAFKSENPFFMVAMNPSYVQAGRKVHISAKFARKYLKEGGDATVNDMDGRTWCINYQRRENGTSGGLFSGGWIKFSRDNHLEVGDVCVFELVNPATDKFKVVIFRYNKDPSSSYPSPGKKRKLKHKEKESANRCKKSKGPSIEGENRCTSRNPLFIKVIQSCHLIRSPLHVPLEFMEAHTKQMKENVTLQVKNKSWAVKLLSHADRGFFSAGWFTFARENCLQAGDVCTFELIDSRTMVFKVHISRNF
ncbi:B3 domain-containing transcription factor VRN1 isoform X2 [Jatropha curcas]|uniref:B3 domain-containing transcription factor VRN1 isoform X2 n=1 Tax=Jatropha curcas TaxID=180498 RepID=UPI001895D2EA|nr:B3 domain-containing transcription factor VRN1 isoform X2 [Jatropha curcas]